MYSPLPIDSTTYGAIFFPDDNTLGVIVIINGELMVSFDTAGMDQGSLYLMGYYDPYYFFGSFIGLIDYQINNHMPLAFGAFA